MYFSIIMVQSYYFLSEKTIFVRKIWWVQKNAVILRYKFEAIHNKDYSVVKTSRTGSTRPFFLCHMCYAKLS